MQFSIRSMKPVPNSHSLSREFFVYLFYVAAFLLLAACVALPTPPRTSLCVFTNTFLPDSPYPIVNESLKKDPKLLGKVMPPEYHYFRCRNSSSTKYNIPVTSESADKMIATPYSDYLEMNAYYKKLADVFQKELNSRTGGK